MLVYFLIDLLDMNNQELPLFVPENIVIYDSENNFYAWYNSISETLGEVNDKIKG